MNLLSVLIVLAALACVGALAAGLVAMARGDEFNRKHSTRLMSVRIAFHALTLALLLVAFMASTH